MGHLELPRLANLGADDSALSVRQRTENREQRNREQRNREQRNREQRNREQRNRDKRLESRRKRPLISVL
jgi:hypothetical protein